MNQRVPIIATDAVGAAAGGLVRDGRNGLVVPAGDADALATALRTLHGDPELRARLGLRLLASTSGRGFAIAPARRDRAMRRLLTALAIACLAAPAVAHADSGVDKLLADACNDEHIDGHYTQAQYKKALEQLPTDADEYTACRDVLQRGRLAALGSGKKSNGGGGGSTGTPRGGGGGGGTPRGGG